MLLIAEQTFFHNLHNPSGGGTHVHVHIHDPNLCQGMRCGEASPLALIAADSTFENLWANLVEEIAAQHSTDLDYNF